MGFLDQLLLGVKTINVGGNPVTLPAGTPPPVKANFTGSVTGAYNPTTQAIDLTFTGGSSSGQRPGTISAGLNSNIATGSQPTLQLAMSGAPGAYSIGGFSPAPTPGTTLTVLFDFTQPGTLVNGDVSSTTTCRISTGTGANVPILPGKLTRMTFVYNGASDFWDLQNAGLLYPNEFNVRDYGAVGDGVTDDYASFVAAIAAMGPAPTAGPSYTPASWAGRTLRVPQGNYRLSQALHLTRSIRLLGDAATFLSYTGSADARSATTLLFDWGVSGLVVDSVFQGVGGRGDDSIIEHITILGNGQGGPVLAPSQWIPGHTYSLGAIVTPSYYVPVGYAYKCTTAGTSASTYAGEPAWQTAAPWPPGPWQASNHYVADVRTSLQFSQPNVGSWVQPTTPNGHVYECTVSGTSAGSEPIWPTGSGATVVDNGVTWTEAGPVNTVADNGTLVWTLIQAHGITVNATSYCDNVTVSNFPGDGFHYDSLNYFVSTPNGGDVQANASRLTNCSAWYCGGSGAYFNGRDSNACMSLNFQANHNLGWGIYDFSSLGNAHFGHKVAFQIAGSIYSNNAFFFGGYCEGSQGPAVALNLSATFVGGNYPDAFSGDYHPNWATSTVYTAQVSFVDPANGYIYLCTTGGTSSGSAPTWPLGNGKTVTDSGGVVWTCYGLSAKSLGNVFMNAGGGRIGVKPFIVTNNLGNVSGVQSPVYFSVGVSNTKLSPFGWGTFDDGGSNFIDWTLTYDPTTKCFDFIYENASALKALSLTNSGHACGDGQLIAKNGIWLGFQDESLISPVYNHVYGNSCVPGPGNTTGHQGDIAENSFPFPGSVTRWTNTQTGATAYPYAAGVTLVAGTTLVRPTGQNGTGIVGQSWQCTTATATTTTEPAWPASPTIGVTTATDGAGNVFTYEGLGAVYVPSGVLEHPDLLTLDCSAGGTITLSDWEACHRRIKLTGSPGSGFNLVVKTPYVSRISSYSNARLGYEALPNSFDKLFINASGQTVTLKTTSGDTGVTLATTHSGYFWSDGTNMQAIG